MTGAIERVKHISQPVALGRYTHLSGLLYNTPILMAPQKAFEIEAVLTAQALGLVSQETNASEQEGAIGYRQPSERRPYRVTEGGVAVIPVVGSLMHRAHGILALSGLMSYGRIEAMLQTALGDSEVKAVLLDVDSPGGQVAGLFDMVDRLRAARESKPIWAVANESALSAAYAMGSAAGRLITPRTGHTGSIGVVALHVDETEKDKQEGRRYVPIYAGARKVDFSPHLPLAQEALDRAQAEVNRTYELFLATVAANRGIDAQAARNTEAATLNADDALSIGLIDAVQSFDDTLAELEAQVSRPRQVFPNGQAAHQPKETATMPGEVETQEAASTVTAITTADVDRARQEGAAQGATDERARIGTILNSEAAKNRGTLAMHFATETSMSADEAVAALAAAPEASQAPASELARHMAALGDPAITPDAETTDADDAKATAARIVSLVQ